MAFEKVKSTTAEDEKQLYDKRDDFTFPVITYLPFINSSIPASPTYEVYISQLIRYSRTCTQYSDCLDRDQLLTQKLLKQGYGVARLKLSLQTFYGRHQVLAIPASYNTPLVLHMYTVKTAKVLPVIENGKDLQKSKKSIVI
jgi:hypothetical protein